MLYCQNSKLINYSKNNVAHKKLFIWKKALLWLHIYCALIFCMGFETSTTVNNEYQTNDSYRCQEGTAGVCNCSASFVNCSFGGLQVVPNDININVISIDLSNNFITYIDWKYFSSFTNIEIIKITDNKLQNVSYSNEVLSFKELYIDNCGLSYFNFSSFCNLKVLNAAGNTLLLSSDAFSCLKDLEEINLSSNKLTTLPYSIFNGLEKLKVLNLAGNPWQCDCHFIWMRLFLESLIATGGHILEENNTICMTNNLSSSANLMYLNKFDFSVCQSIHHSYRHKKSTDIQFDWLKMCPQLNAGLNILCGPSKAASCVYDFPSQNYSLVQYSLEKKSVTSISTCRNLCNENGNIYFVFNSNQPLCLCGDLNNRTTCADCSSSKRIAQKLCYEEFVNIPGATSIFYDFVIGYFPTQPVVMSKVNFYMYGGPTGFDNFTWSFGDGVRLVTNSKNVSHIYIYPGSFKILVTLYSSVLKMKVEIGVQIIISQPEFGLLDCPSLVSTSEKFNISASFASSWQQNVAWSRRNSNIDTQGGCQTGWTEFRQKCIILQEKTTSMTLAYQNCLKQGGQLFQFNSKTELEEINSFLHLAKPNFTVYTDAIWSNSCNTFVWKSTNQKAFVFKESLKNKSDGDCIILSSLGLSTTDCLQNRSYICEKAPVACTGIFVNNICYVIVNQSTSWDQAEEICQASFTNGHLVIIPDVFVNSVVTNQAFRPLWIGLKSGFVQGQYYWSNGQLLNGYTNWANKSVGESCVSLNTSGLWFSQSCSDQNFFMCQYDFYAQTNAQWQIAGTVPVFDSNVNYTLLHSGGYSEIINTYSFILPGSWFSGSGRVLSWNFKTKSLNNATVIALQIWRPFCISGVLTKPGCGTESSLFSCTTNVTAHCDIHVDCADGQYYCLLTQGCQKLSSPCTCAGVSPVSGIRCQNMAVNTSFKLISTINVTLPQGSTLFHFDLPVDMVVMVEPGDVIGFQTESQDTVKCDDSPASPWQHPVLWQMTSNWKMSADVAESKNYQFKNNVTCLLNAMSSDGDKLKLPGSLSYLKEAGNYSFTLEANLQKAAICSVTALDVVGGLIWIYPHPESFNQSTVVVNVMTNVDQIFVLKILHGSDVTTLWKNNKGDIILSSLSSSCPSSVADVVSCRYNSSLLANPYSVIHKKFSSSKIDIFFISVFNKISSRNLTVEVHPYIQIEGLEFFNANCPSHDNCVVTTLELGVSQVFTVQIKSGDVITKSFFINGIVIQNPVWNFSHLVYTFNRTSQYHLTVNVSNPVSWMSRNITVFVSTRANFTSLNFINMSESYPLDAATSFTAMVPVTEGSSLFVIWSFGTKSLTHTVLSANSSEFFTMFTFITPGYNTVGLTLTDYFGNQINSSVKVFIYKSVQTLKLIPFSNTVATYQTFNMSITINNEIQDDENYYGHLTYTVDFGDGSDAQSWTDTEPTQFMFYIYNKTGDFTVKVNVYSDFEKGKVISESFNLTVQETITGLILEYDGPKHVSQEIVFTVNYSTGTDISFSLDYGDGTQATEFQNYWTFPYKYLNASVYEAKVTAKNLVSKSSQSLTMFAYDEHLLQIIKLKFPQCVSSHSSVDISTEVAAQNPRSLEYYWLFGNSKVANGTGLQKTSTVYEDIGNYDISLSVLNASSSKSHSLNRTICVQEIISGVSVNFTSPVAFNQSRQPENVLLVATVTSGSHMTYSWSLGNVTIVGIGETFSLKVTEPKNYLVTVRVANSISRENKSIAIQAISIITGLKIECTSCSNSTFAKTHINISLIAELTFGSHETYMWTVENSTSYLQGKSIKYMFNTARNYLVTVSSDNPVSKQIASIFVMAQDEVTGVNLTASPSTVGKVNESIFLQVTWVSGTDVDFDWRCDLNNNTFSANNISKTFATEGPHTCTVVVANKVSKAEQSLHLDILNLITSLSVNHSLLIVQNSTVLYAVKGKVYDFSLNSNTDFMVLFEWNFTGDKGSNTHSGRTFTITFHEHSTGNLILKASNALSQKSVTLLIDIQDEIKNVFICTNVSSSQIINFPLNISVGDTVLFYFNLTSGSSYISQWFQDGTLLNQVNDSPDSVIINFKSVGQYLIELQISNAVSSLKSSVTVRVLEPVSNTTIKINGVTNFPYFKKGSTLILSAKTVSGSFLSYNWSIISDSKGQIFTSNLSELPYTFSDSATYKLKLTVYNSLNFQNDEMTVISQGAVINLNMSMKNQTTATDKSVSLSAYTNPDSTSVSYTWNISGDVIYGAQVNKVFQHPGVQVVLLTASNNVSSSSLQELVYVFDAISNLTAVDCAVPQEAQKILLLRSSVDKGTNVSFSWIIDKTVSLWGQTINYTFPREGIYIITLTAANAVDKKTFTCSKKLYVPVGYISLKLLEPNPDYIFQNQNVTFKVTGGHLWLANFEWTYYLQTVNSVRTASNTYTTLFQTVGNYNLLVNVSNDISYSTVTLNFTVKECLCQLPEVTVIGTPSRTYKRSTAIELEVNVDTKDCAIYVSQHKWTLFRSQDCINLTVTDEISLGNISTSSLKLIVQSRTLYKGIYCVSFTTGYHYTSVAESVFFKLNITATPLKAVIKGGTKRTVAYGSEICMDGSLSFNPDDPDASSQLFYTWECIEVSSNGGCFPSETIKRFCYQSFKPGLFQIILKVESGDSEPGIAVQLVNVLNNTTSIPLAGIVCNSCTKTGSFRVSASQQVSLTAICEMCPCQPYVVWSIFEDQAKIIPNSSQSPTGMHGQSLLLTKWGVLRDNHNYTVVLDMSCEKDFSQYGSASLELLANVPPSGGTCTIVPTKIIPLQNQVTVSCLDWMDEDDFDSPLIYSIFVDSKNTRTNQNKSYLLYLGTSQTQSIYLAFFSEDTISLRVMVSDNCGASTLGGVSSIQLESPTFLANITTTDYLSAQADTRLAALTKQAKPSSLMQFAIALSYILNKESHKELAVQSSTTDSVSEQRRAAIRDAIAICLSTAFPISTLADVQLMAYALRLLTDYSTEFLTEDTQLLIMMTLRTIQDVLSQELKTVQGQEDIPVDDLIAVITNLIKAVNMPIYSSSPTWNSDKTITIDDFMTDFRNLRPETSAVAGQMSFHKIGLGLAHRKSVISSIVPFLEELIVDSLISTVIGGKGIELEVNDIKLQGQRCYAKDINTYSMAENVQFHLSPEILTRQKQKLDEVLQIQISYKQNPYTYGYDDLTYNYMPVQTISFYETTGLYIPLSDLSETDSVKINLMSGTNITNASDSSILYSPFQNLSYSTVNILPKKNKFWIISNLISNLKEGIGVHIQLRIKFLPNDSSSTGLNVKGTTVYCYLGLNSSPSSSQYLQKLSLTSEMMETGTDHRFYTFFTNQLTAKDKLYVLATNDDNYHEVKLSVSLYYSFCNYFNTTYQMWDQEGCLAQDVSTAVNISCHCNHLTSFSGAALAPIVNFDFADLANLNLSTNPVVFIAVAIIFSVYVITALICKYFDIMDLKRITHIPLCGRNGEYKYKVTVVTGRLLGAGTSANVGIMLYGIQGKGQARHLTKNGAFQRNCQDSFLVAFNTNLGEITKIIVWHDNSGISPSWFLSHVVVQDIQTKANYTFIVNSWLSLEMENGYIQKTVFAADDVQLKKFNLQFSTVFYAKLAEMHTWISVSNRPDHSKFTRVQRATCCLTCTYLYMGINAIWYGVFKSKSDTDSDISWSSFGWEEIITALMSTIMVLPLLFGLSTLFKRTRFKESALMQARRPSTAHTLEIDADIDFNSTSESCKTVATLGEWEMSGIEMENTADSLPVTSKLKRTAPVHRRNNEIKSNDHTADTAVKELWSKESILQSWPDRMPEWIEQVKGQNNMAHPLLVADRSIEGNSADAIKSSKRLKSNKISVLSRRRSSETSDDEFDQKLNELTIAIDKNEIRKKKKVFQILSKKNVTDDLFNSDDEWAHVGLDEMVKESAKCGASHSFGESELSKHTEKHQFDDSINKKFDSSTEDSYKYHKTKRLSIVSFSSKTKTIASGRTHSFSLESQISQKKIIGCTLPPWFLYMTYALCGKLSLLSIILVLWYGYKFGANIALKWLVSLCFSVFASVLVVEPLKVVILAVILTVIKKGVDNDDPSLLDITPAEETNEQIKDVKFKPLGGFALLHAREEGKKKQRLATMLRETAMFILMFSLFLSIVYISYSSTTMYHNNYNIQNKLYKLDNRKINLSNLKSIHHFWQWSQDVMAKVIHLRELDQSENFGFLMGPAWLRQIRGTKASCPIASSIAQISPKELNTYRCLDLPTDGPPSHPFEVGWSAGSSNWTFSESSELNMYSKFGQSLFYTGGGYIRKLGLTYNETLSRLHQLKVENWIDHLTRAVFVEFTLYSASTDLTTCGSVLIEFPITGGLLVSSSVQSEKLLRYISGKIQPLLVCQVIFLLFVLYLTVNIVIRLCSEKLHYFLGFWNWIDSVICLIAWSNSGLYLTCILKATNYINKFLSSPSDSSYLAQVVLMHAVYRYLHACLVFLFCLKVVRQVRYSKSLYKFYMTLSKSSSALMGAFFIFIILLFSYAQLGYLVFGSAVQEFSTFQQSVTAMFGFLFGKICNFSKISESSNIFSLFIFISFCFIAYGLVTAMSVSILSWSFKWCKSQMYCKTTLDVIDYEMIDFMIRKFKLMTGMIKQKPAFRRVKFADQQSTSCQSNISTPESSQSINKSSTNLFDRKWTNPLTYDPVRNLQSSWDRVLNILQKVEEIDKYEDETTTKLKQIIDTWKSFGVLALKDMKHKTEVNKKSSDENKNNKSWQRIRYTFYQDCGKLHL